MGRSNSINIFNVVESVYNITSLIILIIFIIVFFYLFTRVFTGGGVVSVGPPVVYGGGPPVVYGGGPPIVYGGGPSVVVNRTTMSAPARAPRTPSSRRR